MELLESARRLGDFPTRFVLWRALQARDRTVLDLYVDALEDYIAALNDICDVLSGMVRTLRRASRLLERQRHLLEGNVAQFLREGKTDLAHMAQHRLLTLDYLAATYERLLHAQEREYEAYRDVRLLLEATLSEARQRREEVEEWLDKGAAETIPEFARPLPDWDEEALTRRLEMVLNISEVEKRLASQAVPADE